MTRRTPLAAYGISFRFRKNLVLDEVSLELEAGEITAILGPNGSGKSTFLKILAGIIPLKIAEGQVHYFGGAINDLSPKERARQVAFVPPEITTEFPLTSYETVMMGRICHSVSSLRLWTDLDRDAVEWAMSECNCWSLRERHLHTLSGGERQQVALARALAQEAKVLLLDEALSKMDLNHQAKTGSMLKKFASRGYAIILVAHDVNLASEIASRCVFIKNGKIACDGPVSKIITIETVKNIYPGAEFIVGQNPTTKTPKVFFCSPS